MQLVTIGVDPDLHGAISIFDHHRALVSVVDTPITEEGKIEPADISALLRDWIRDNQVKIFLEHGNPGRHNGAKSIAVTNEIYGVWRGLATAYGIELVSVLPYAWKGRFGLNTDQINAQQDKITTRLKKTKREQVDDIHMQVLVGTSYQQSKEAARLKAIELFPNWLKQLEHKGNHGRAEAILIGWYGVRKYDKRIG